MFQALCFIINITGTGVYSRYRYLYAHIFESNFCMIHKFHILKWILQNIF